MKLVSYTYDAWGNASATETTNTVVANNPFRYRGYYYDIDLSLYYLNTRYYDAKTGRFINTDSALYHNMLGYNMFAYCNNNPVIYYDPTGESLSVISTFWNELGKVASSTTTWIDDALWFAGTLVLGGITAEEMQSRDYYNPMLDFNYQQKFIADTTAPPQSIAQDSDSPVSSTLEIKAKEEYDPNPYRRPGEKKQNRENRSKSRTKPKWEPRNNRRDGKPAKVPKHTPSKKGHKKYCSIEEPIKIF